MMTEAAVRMPFRHKVAIVCVGITQNRPAQKYTHEHHDDGGVPGTGRDRA
ncbi:hypothetical protein [Kistimonas scapharcae]